MKSFDNGSKYVNKGNSLQTEGNLNKLPVDEKFCPCEGLLTPAACLHACTKQIL